MANPSTEESDPGTSARPVHLTWLRCPQCRRPLVPLYVVDGLTFIEPSPHIEVIAARLTCPACGEKHHFESRPSRRLETSEIVLD